MAERVGPATKQARAERDAAVKALEDFKQQVIRETMDHEAGCAEGKVEFLSRLGLEAAASQWVIVVRVKKPKVSLEDLCDRVYACVEANTIRGSHLLDKTVWLSGTATGTEDAQDEAVDWLVGSLDNEVDL